MAEIKNVPRLSLQSLLLKDSAIWLGTMEFRKEVRFTPTSSLILETELAVDEIVEGTPDSGVTIETVLIKDGDICLPGQLKADTVSENSADVGVTVDGVLMKDDSVRVPASGNVQTDAVDESTLDAGVLVDGVLHKDAQVSTDQINELSTDAGVTVDGVLLKDAQVSTDQINELSADAGVTVDGVLHKDAQVSTDQINELSADAGVTVDGVLLKDNNVNADEVQTDSIVESTLDAGVIMEGVLLKDSNVDVPAVGKVIADTFEGKTTPNDGSIFGIPISMSKIPVSNLTAQPLILRGCWNATTNMTMPDFGTLVDGAYSPETMGPATDGDYWLVDTAGPTIVDGHGPWSVGDAAVFASGMWVRLDHVSEVVSVNGMSGAVVLDTDDIAEGSTNLYFTDARVDARASIAQWNASQLQGLDIDSGLADPGVQNATVGWDDTANQYVNKSITATTGTAVVGTDGAITIQNQNAHWNANQIQGLSVATLTDPNDDARFLGWNDTASEVQLKQFVNGDATGTPLTFNPTNVTIQNDNAAWNANKIRSLDVITPFTDPADNAATLAWDDTNNQIKFKTINATDGAAVSSNLNDITVQNQSAWWNANRLQGSVVLNTISADPNDHCAILAWDDDNNGWTNKTLTDDNAGLALTCIAGSITIKNQTAAWNANQLQGLSVDTLTDPAANDRLLGWDDTANNVKFKQLAAGSATGTPLTLAATAITIQNDNAAWNANKIQTVDVDATTPTNGQSLIYNLAMTRWQPGFPAGSSINIVGNYKTDTQSFADETAFPADTVAADPTHLTKIVRWSHGSGGSALTNPANKYLTLTTVGLNSKFKIDISMHQGGSDDTYGQYLLRFQVAGTWNSVLVNPGGVGPPTNGSNTLVTFGHHQNAIHGRFESQTVHYSLLIGGTAGGWSIPAGTVVRFEVLAKPEGTTDNGKVLLLNTTVDTASNNSTSGTSSITIAEIAA